MKKSVNISRKLLFIAVLCLTSAFVKAQGFEPNPGFSQVDFGFGVDKWGVPIYAGLDFGLSDHITIGPRVAVVFDRGDYYLNTRYGHTIFNLMFRGDYHFANLIDALPSQLDLYGGADLGYGIWIDNYNDSNVNITSYDGLFFNVHAGARWYWTRNWGANAEVTPIGTYGGVYNGSLKVGLSYIF